MMVGASSLPLRRLGKTSVRPHAQAVMKVEVPATAALTHLQDI
jgi:hypothetical protein